MKNDKFLIIVFLIIIFGVLIFFPIKHILISTGKIELQMTDNWKFYENTGTNFIGKIEDNIKSKINSLENRVTNYFPMYLKINNLYQNINYATNKITSNNIIPIGKNSDDEYIFYDSKDKFYFLETKLTKKDLDNRLKKQVTFFNNLNEQLDKEIYIYLPTRYELTNIKENNLNYYIDKFKENLNPNIKVSTMQINSKKEYLKYFYKTDHHWNIYGALNGYESIMDLLNKSKIPNLQVKKVMDRKYYGSIAKSAMSTRIGDELLDIDYKSNLKVLVNGSNNKKYKPRKINYNKNNIYFDYYIHYFNGQFGNVVYDNNDSRKENLLILSDSYAWQIDYLIAESFNKTHVINLRYDDYKNGVFDIKNYIEINNIDKVLFLYEGGSTLFDMFDYNFVEKVK